MSNEEKVYALQQLENMMADKQNRKSRTLTTEVPNELRDYVDNFEKTLKQSDNEGVPSAMYTSENTENIYLFRLEVNGLDAANIIVHEGFHALIDDFINGKASLKTFSKPNLEDFIREICLFPESQDFADNHKLMIFAIDNVEDRLVYPESIKLMVKCILELAETPSEAHKITESIYNSIILLRRVNLYKKQLEKTYGTVGDILKEVEEKRNKSLENEYLAAAGKLENYDDEDFENYFSRIYNWVDKICIIYKDTSLSKQEKYEFTMDKLARIEALTGKYIAQMQNKKIMQ